ncbi:MAG TPA: isoleucine--tRNA ligase, partial [candidate division Zixibacteria bacterium]|nr:isoleucine--tRNA ligase [candidate division Zixibacteria bacterium]
PQFIFFEGPPTANGRPGIHHIISRTIKDIVCRYKALTGYRVDRKGGWDTHGLPVEIEVEKRLGLKNKQDVVKYGIENFNQECRNSVFTYLEDWNKITRRTGFWLDLENPYVTLTNEYIESVWWILKDFFDRGLIYEGHKTVPFCPRCGTGLSSHEVAQGYEEVADPSVFVKMKAVGEDYSFLVWTTTPWTLPSNLALAVKADADYVIVEFEGEKLLLAEALLNKVFAGKDETPQPLKTLKGADLLGKSYTPLFDYFKDSPAPAFTVTAGDFVTLEDGTGIVHIAPGYGADDYELGQRISLPMAQAVESDGLFKKLGSPYDGMWIKDADLEIIKDLKKSNQLFKKEKYTHNYPFCWRCHSPLIYIARPSWYIRTTQFKNELLASCDATSWKPPEIGAGRMRNWLENNIDWAISRERFWGTPLPFWRCGDDSCGKLRAVGSIDQLLDEANNAPAREDVDLHKPQMDQVTLTCECGAEMRRIPELLDVWFDSGAMPFAQWHYPFENKELVEQIAFPADFISEGVDQTRGWFYSLLAIATLLKAGHPELGREKTGQAYRNVLVIEFILDKFGKKMSKHKGNVVDPFEMVQKYGSDPLRWYMLTTSSPWTPTRFDEDGLVETLRKYFDTLKNCYNFFALYANIDNIKEDAAAAGVTTHSYLSERAGEPERIDRWITSRYESLLKDVRSDYEQLELTRALRKINDFVIDDLSNWYVRRNRKRFWRAGADAGKMRAYLTLYDILLGVAKLTAPATPLVSELLYRELADQSALAKRPSVHMDAIPTPDDALIDETLEERTALVQQAVSLGRAARTRHNLKVRQPLAQLQVALPGGVTLDELKGDWDTILGELNIKKLSAMGRTSDFVTYNGKLNFATAGKKFGARVKLLGETVTELNGDQLKALEAGAPLHLSLEGHDLTLEPEDVLITKTEKEGFAVESNAGVTVALSTGLTPELIAEGFARETVNKIQNLRKQANFEVTDRITVAINAAETLRNALPQHEQFILSETLADRLEYLDSAPSTDGGLTQECDINGERATIRVQRV